MNQFAPFEERRDIWLNDIAFSNVDHLGNRWIIEDLDGWWELPAPTMGEVDRAYSEDGSFYEPGRFESRVIRMKGRILPPNRTQNANNIARQEFNRRLQLVRRTGLLRVLESPELGGGKQSEVVIVARPLVSPKDANGTIRFDVQFRAPDPRKYSIDLEKAVAFILAGEEKGRTYDLTYKRNYEGSQSNNTVNVFNRGDYNTYGILRFHGPVDDPSATHLESGKSISFEGLRIVPGQYLDVDLMNKTVLMDSGVSMRSKMTPDSQWFNFEPGNNKVSYSGTQYVEPIESVPDARNNVINPSFEYVDHTKPQVVVRRNFAPNPSGSYSVNNEVIREFLHVDSYALGGGFMGTNVSQGTITSSPVIFKNTTNSPYKGTSTFESGGQYVFAQLELTPTFDTTATLTVGSNTSGAVPITAGKTTTLRVDGQLVSTNFTVTLDIPGVTSAKTVAIGKVMLTRSPKPFPGVVPFSDPAPTYRESTGTLVSYNESTSTYIETKSTPNNWTITGPGEAKFYIDNDGNLKLSVPVEGTYEIDFGAGTTSGTRVFYGVIPFGTASKHKLYNHMTGDLLKETAPSYSLDVFESATAFTPRLTMTTKLIAGTITVNTAVTYTTDAGTALFHEDTMPVFPYSYQSNTFGGPYTAVETISSFTDQVASGTIYNKDSAIVQSHAHTGDFSLKIRYLKDSAEHSKPTPITGIITTLFTKKYFITFSARSDLGSSYQFDVEGATNPLSMKFTTTDEWTTYRLEMDHLQGSNVRLVVRPTSDTIDQDNLYVDSVGVLSEDIKYFDGDSGVQYRWNGTPHQSTSDTIAIAGIPKSQLEILYRSAWIG